jgi:hypothetical protein
MQFGLFDKFVDSCLVPLLQTLTVEATIRYLNQGESNKRAHCMLKVISYSMLYRIIYSITYAYNVVFQHRSHVYVQLNAELRVNTPFFIALIDLMSI